MAAKMNSRIEPGKLIYYGAEIIVANVNGGVLKKVLRTKISVIKIKTDSGIVVVKWTMYNN